MTHASGVGGVVAASPWRRAWKAPLFAHAAVLAVVLLVLVPVMAPGSSFSSDEGGYALAAQALQEGSWSYDYKAAPFDPEGRWFPLINSTGAGGEFYAYIQHPAYVMLLRGSLELGNDDLALRLVPLAGAVLTAVAAWLLAGQWSPSYSRPAFWLAAASPVAVNGFALWAHAPSSAVAGLSLAGAARLVRSRDRPAPLVVAATTLGLAVGVLLRSEALLFAGALAAGVALVLFLPRSPGVQRSARLVRSAAYGAVLALPAAAMVVAERAWVRSITGGADQNFRVRGDAESYGTGRAGGVWHELFQGHYDDVEASLPVIIAMGLGVGLAYLALRRWRERSARDLVAAATAATLLYGFRLVQHPREAVTGLFVAWPLALLGLLLTRWRASRSGDDSGDEAGDENRAATILLTTTLVLFTAAVAVTVYPEGGGLEWGGRFFSPLTAALAAIAVVAIGLRLPAGSGPERRMAVGALVVLAAAPALFGLAVVRESRLRQDALIAAVERHPTDVTVTTVDALPRVAWRTHDDRSWMLSDDDDLDQLLGTLRQHNVGSVALVTRADLPPEATAAYPDATAAPEPALAKSGLQLLLLQG